MPAIVAVNLLGGGVEQAHANAEQTVIVAHGVEDAVREALEKLLYVDFFVSWPDGKKGCALLESHGLHRAGSAD
jgi:hypothetical protein